MSQLKKIYDLAEKLNEDLQDMGIRDTRFDDLLRMVDIEMEMTQRADTAEVA